MLVMHKLRDDVVNGPAPVRFYTREHTVCGEGEAADIFTTSVPPSEVKAKLPEHRECRVCFPKAN